ncbi:hypothetical protein CBR_g48886 [Chara braunii]|uniref:Uncharacterized protein n=1 Tax=Chara braunii TaxID=69332 RepID=A0A388M3K9_CHABU|nr:hypothetical protein CBR_g48886 [Chara braunii]|eukprot:GBG89178.1 hypothetical protein CBR_g48886 [Chara braunii]
MAACTTAAVAGSSTWAALSATTRRDSDAASCSSCRASLPAARRRWPLACRARSSLLTSFALHLGRRSLRLATQNGSSSSSFMPSSTTTSASAMVAAASTSAMVDRELGFCSNGRSSSGWSKLVPADSQRPRAHVHGDGLGQVRVLREPTKQTRSRFGRGAETVRRRGEQQLARAVPPSDENQGSNWEEELDEEDLRTGLNEVSNKAIRVMLSGDIQALQEMKEEVNSIGEYLAQEKQWDAARFMLVLLGLLEKKVIDEADQLEGMYKEAFEKIGQVIDDSGWALARPDKDLPGEAMDDGVVGWWWVQ